MGEDVSVIIPAYNEQSGILQTIKSLRGIESIKEVIVVDDGSTDRTYALLEPLEEITLLHHKRNKGKGYAVKQAISHVNCPYVALLDADLCESASEVNKLIEFMSSGKKMIIIGKLKPPSRKGGFGLVKKVSHSAFEILTQRRVESLLSGQRVLPLDFLKSIDLPRGFGLEFKITLEGIRKGYEMIEVPVDMHHRETGRNIKGFMHRGKQCFDILELIGKELIYR